MIEVKNINKSFDDKQVLCDISATFYDGKTNLIIGLSGSGKTVLMKSMVGLVTPESGKILYDGRDLLKMDLKQKKELRKEIGMLFQGSALFDSETVLGNVMFPLTMFSTMTNAEMKERAEFCIERVNLKDANHKYPSELSGLDPKTSILIDELLSDITHEYGITTIINTHDMNSVLGIGENILFVNKGRCGWVGNKDEIYDSGNEALDNFVFATRLFMEVKKAHALTATSR